MNGSENICPVCQTNNEPAASVCGHCGAALDDYSFAETRYKTKTTDMQALSPEAIQDWKLKEANEAVVPNIGIAFYVEGYAKPAYTDSEGEFVLGRKAGVTTGGLLDLAPFGGYSMGLSRRHAVIRQTADGYQVMDLGSVNGTWLNGERLTPHTTYPLPSGSHLRLGRMRILVLYRAVPETG